MARNRQNGAFVFGALVGGAAGAMTALWKTPYSGVELRRKLGLPGNTGTTSPAEPIPSASPESASPQESRPLTARALAFVEYATAPLVGVKLGQTANNSQPGSPTPVPVTAPEAAPVAAGDRITDSEFSDFPAQQPVGATQG
jgi:hypothetical protein